MVEIIPSLPASSFAELAVKVGKVRNFVSTFQIDVCDGMFVTRRSWPMNPGDRTQFEQIVSGKEALPFSSELSYEVHFMAHNPEKLIPAWVKAGVVRVFLHVEARHDFSACRVAAGDAELGVSIKIGTPLSRVEPYLPHISVIQFMGIDPIGIQGQPFNPRVLSAVREARALYPNVTIQVDGAVNADTAPLLLEAGATRLAPGSYILNSDDPQEAIRTLTQ